MNTFDPREMMLEHCTACTNGMVLDHGRVTYCNLCHGTTRRLRTTHDHRSGIDGDDLHSPTDGGGACRREPAGADREKPSDARGGDGAVAAPARSSSDPRAARMVELARLIRAPENSAPLTELLNLIERKS